MSKTVMIPDNQRPFWTCDINNKKYSYPSGTEQTVPDEVAAIIKQYYDSLPKEDPLAGKFLPEDIYGIIPPSKLPTASASQLGVMQVGTGLGDNGHGKVGTTIPNIVEQHFCVTYDTTLKTNTTGTKLVAAAAEDAEDKIGAFKDSDGNAIKIPSYLVGRKISEIIPSSSATSVVKYYYCSKIEADETITEITNGVIPSAAAGKYLIASIKSGVSFFVLVW